MATQYSDGSKTTTERAAQGRRSASRWFLKPAIGVGMVAGMVAGALNASAIGGSRLDAGFNDPALATLNIPASLAPLNILEKPLTTTEPEPPAARQQSRILWGFEASAGPSQIHTFDINTGWTGQSCAPPQTPPYQNGRGLAMDPRDGNLWYTVVSDPVTGFLGDHLIHKTTPPNSQTPCANVGALNYDQQVQPDLGALEIDPDSKHIWAAGYKPLCLGNVDPVTGACNGTPQSWFYLINKNNGDLLRSCWTVFRDGGVGNDTLALAKFGGIPNTSGKYLLSDAGEDISTPNTVGVFDAASCHDGNQVFSVYEIQKAQRGDAVTGIEYEWPGLITATGGFGAAGQIYVGGTFPAFTPDHVISSSPSVIMEDLALCGFRAKFQQSSLTSPGPTDDLCPFQRPDEENCDNGRHVSGEGNEESDDHQHHGQFKREACNPDRTKDGEQYDNNDDNVHFRSTRTDSTTYDPTTNSTLTTGLGQLNGTDIVTYSITTIDYHNPLIPNVYSLTLGNGYVHTGHVTLGTLTIG